MFRVAVLIDGGNLRVLAKKAKHLYNPDYIEKIAHACANADEKIFRILYYDCAPYTGEVKLPVSGNAFNFIGSDKWLKDLAKKDYFAVRQGVLKFRGFKPKKIPISPAALVDDDFKPDFEQKGVDMRIGLDIASYSSNGSIDRIVLITGDTDCIPAMKHGRKTGIQVVIIRFPNSILAPELLAHADFTRDVAWPAP